VARITACSTLNYPDYPLEEAARRIAARGFRRVDIVHLGYYCLHFPLGDEECPRIAAVLQEQQLTPVALNHYGGSETWCHRLDRPDEVRDFLAMSRSVLKQAQQVGIPKVMTSIGRRMTGAEPLDRIRCAARVISQVADEAAEMGIGITVEVPHAYSLAYNLANVALFFEHVASPHVQACVDCSHWGLLDYDFDELMSIVGNRLGHVHLRDSAGTDDGSSCQNLELTPGKGEVDFAAFAAYLDKDGYHGEVTLETEYRGLSLERIEAELDASLIHLSQCGWQLPAEVEVLR
jgi:sugar phosphate isomerase/epimerase